MILHAFQCETCKILHPFTLDPLRGSPYSQLPDSWIMLTKGYSQVHEGRLYCSEACLAKSLGVQPQAPIEDPQTTMRRFRLFTEDGDEKQGMLCEDGHVIIDDHDQNKEAYYQSWDACKAAYEGGGVTWIDPEIKQESSEQETDETVFTRWNGEPLDGWGER